MAFRDSIRELAEVAKELRAESDELNALIEEREAQIQQTGVGISAWLVDTPITFSPLDKNAAVEGWILGYGKLGGKWRVGVQPMGVLLRDGRPAYTPPRGPPLPLLDAPREVRAEALGMLGELAWKLAQRAREYTRSMKRTPW